MKGYLTDKQRSTAVEILMDSAEKARRLTDEMFGAREGISAIQMRHWPQKVAALNSQSNSAAKLLVAEAVFFRGVVIEDKSARAALPARTR